MALGTEKIAETFLNIVVNTPIDCDWPLYAEDEVEVVYGSASLLAILNTDYTVTLSGPNYDQFQITPLASLLTKINNLIVADPTNEINYITVRRVLDYKTSVTPESVRGVAFLSREVERVHMRFQQLSEAVTRCLKFPRKEVGDDEGNPNLPAKDIRLDSILCFTSDGDVTVKSAASLNLLTAFYQDGNTTSANVSIGDYGTVTAGAKLDVNGVLAVGSGSAAAPSVAFRTDMNTGLYRVGADELGVSAGGVLQFSVLGTASAVNRWQATGGAAGFAPRLTATGSDTDVTGRFAAKGNGGYIFTHNDTGNVTFVANAVASSVNYLSLIPSATGNGVNLRADGTDANIQLNLFSKGVGVIALRGNGSSIAFTAEPVASGVNYLTAKASATGVALELMASGTDSNIAVNVESKGTGFIALQNTAGVVAFTASPVASGVNYLQANSAATGNAVALIAVGTDTNVTTIVQSKGTGEVRLNANNAFLLRCVPAATPANYWQAAAALAGAAPALSVQGTDTDIGLDLVAKGTGSVGLFTAGGGARQFNVAHTANAVNYWQATGNATGLYPILTATGSDTNVIGRFASKGVGGFIFTHNTLSNVTFNMNAVASSTNYPSVYSAATGNRISYRAEGSDTNIGIDLFAKGNGINVLRNTNGIGLVVDVTTGSSVNYLTIAGTATGNPITLTATGSDSNIDVQVVPKGTGTLRLPATAKSTVACTFTASSGPTGANTAIQEWFAVKNAAGTVRYIPAW